MTRLLACILLVVLGACANPTVAPETSPQPAGAPEAATQPDPYLKLRTELDNYLGIADWPCTLPHPYAYARIHVHGQDQAGFTPDGRFYIRLDLVRTIVHELVHVEQMRRHGCAEWDVLRKNPRFQASVEAEAEARALGVTIKPGGVITQPRRR